jgi:hypothetical protein
MRFAAPMARVRERIALGKACPEVRNAFAKKCFPRPRTQPDGYALTHATQRVLANRENKHGAGAARILCSYDL